MNRKDLVVYLRQQYFELGNFFESYGYIFTSFSEKFGQMVFKLEMDRCFGGPKVEASARPLT